MKEPGFHSIAVIGPGLLGGSILKAVRKFLPKCELRIWARRVEALEFIRREKLADRAESDLAPVVEGADLIILALPIQHMLGIVRQFPDLPNDAIVTDVGSTKASVVDSLSGEIAQRGGVFIGSHPMAGSEKTGIEHARADLFSKAAVVVTPPREGDSHPEAVERLSLFWEAIGGEVSLLDPAEHDRIVAAISHLPHLVASALVRSSLQKNGEIYGQLTGGGFRDTTRIAAGDPDMWTGIMMDNRDALLTEIDRLLNELGEWKEILEASDKGSLQRVLSEAKDFREKI